MRRCAIKSRTRPAEIAEILTTLRTDKVATVEATSELEAYISELEAHQQAMPPGEPAHASGSSYWRSVRREKDRKERAFRKQNNYQ